MMGEVWNERFEVMLGFGKEMGDGRVDGRGSGLGEIIGATPFLTCTSRTT